jgi:hypothetical protein
MARGHGESFVVGDEVDFYCRKCRLNLHGNVAAVKDGTVVSVTCRTCRSTQPFIAEKSDEELRTTTLRKAFRIRDRRAQQWAQVEESRPAPTPPKAAKDVTARWRRATEGVDARYAGKYSPQKNYEVDDLLIEKQHGLGIVTRILHENAVLVLFRKDELPLEMNAKESEDELEREGSHERGA